MPRAPTVEHDARLAPGAAAAIRAAIRLAGGREVCFVCRVSDDGIVETARVVSRGDIRSVLALPGFATRGDMLVHNHPSGLLEPSEPDLEIAARMADDGVGFGIVNNGATELYVVVEVPARRDSARLDPAVISRELGPDRAIAAHHPRYEDRPSQRAMAAEIARLYNDGGVGLLEAGTGVGKSLGYLVPALRWAAANGERTIVSTNTINLQEQLVRQDLPFLEKALSDQKVRFALLKGWRNYLCLARLEQARSSGNALFEDGLQHDLDALREWSERTTDGSLSDLAASPRPDLWDEVSAEPDLCQRQRCEFYAKCFVFKARRIAAAADVVVVNHHLLMSDIAVRRASGNWGEAAVLPAYNRLIVDEGHHLEDAAAAHLGASVSRRGLTRLFNRLDRRGKGLLPALLARLASSTDLLGAASRDLVLARLMPATEAARTKSALLFDLLETYVQEHTETTVRLTEAFAEHPIWEAGLRRELDDTLGSIQMIAEGLELVRERFEAADRLDDSAMPLINEIGAVSRRLQNAGDGLRRALTPPRGEKSVRWVEVRGKERAGSVTSVPLDLAPVLREDLFKRSITTIVTSATLAANSRFQFLSQRLGLDDPELTPRTGIYPSPFHFEEQSILAVPTDVPAPNVDAAGHLEAVSRLAFDLVDACDGGMFVLFTSHRDVRAMATKLRALGVDRRWPLLVHGDEMRDVLLNRFRDAGNAVLLGTASFWEGVDVPGDALRALLIAKLPFRVPTEPMTAAQCEAITAAGGDAFRDYMLPHASLRLKQGFGRLIRSGTDRGVVVIADPRVVTKTYGRSMLECLPPAKRIVGKWEKLMDAIRAFYTVIPRERA